MPVFKEEQECKRVIFNVEMSLAARLEKAKEAAKELGKKLDVDTAVNKALEKFLGKAEKHIAEYQATQSDLSSFRISTGPMPPEELQGYGEAAPAMGDSVPPDAEADTAPAAVKKTTPAKGTGKTGAAAKAKAGTRNTAKTGKAAGGAGNKAFPRSRGAGTGKTTN